MCPVPAPYSQVLCAGEDGFCIVGFDCDNGGLVPALVLF